MPTSMPTSKPKSNPNQHLCQYLVRNIHTSRYLHQCYKLFFNIQDKIYSNICQHSSQVNTLIRVSDAESVMYRRRVSDAESVTHWRLIVTHSQCCRINHAESVAQKQWCRISDAESMTQKQWNIGNRQWITGYLSVTQSQRRVTYAESVTHQQLILTHIQWHMSVTQNQWFRISDAESVMQNQWHRISDAESDTESGSQNQWCRISDAELVT